MLIFLRFFFLMWTIFWSLNWIFLQYSLFYLLATRHVGSWFPVQGSNLLPFHWKVKLQPLDHQGSPCMLILLIFFWYIFEKYRVWEHELHFFKFICSQTQSTCLPHRRGDTLKALASERCRFLFMMMTLGRSVQLFESQFCSSKVEMGASVSQDS